MAAADLQLTEDTKIVLKDLFDSKDVEKTGEIDIDTLGECFHSIGIDADDEDLVFLAKHFDENGDGSLETSEIIENLDVVWWHFAYGKDLMPEFKKFENAGQGFIRLPDMLRILTDEKGRYCMQISDAQKLVDELVRKYDKNGDGKFSYPEFVKISVNDMLPNKQPLKEPSEETKKVRKKKSQGLKKVPADSKKTTSSTKQQKK